MPSSPITASPCRRDNDTHTAHRAENADEPAKLRLGGGGEVRTDRRHADRMHEVVDNWRRHAFEVEMTDLSYPGECHDVAQYLNGDGWATSEAKMTSGT